MYTAISHCAVKRQTGSDPLSVGRNGFNYDRVSIMLAYSSCLGAMHMEGRAHIVEASRNAELHALVGSNP